MGYYIDFKSINIDDYREKIRSNDLIPSRKILKDNIDTNFDAIKQNNINNLEELFNILKNKKKLEEFAFQSGLSVDYLTILVREIKSDRQKPNNLRDFPGLTDDTVLKLENQGIRNTLHLYEKILTKDMRKELSQKASIPDDIVLTLTKLTDLSRIRWVNHTFAYVLLEAGYDRLKKVAQTDSQQLYDDIIKINQKQQLYKGKIGLHDMELCIKAARDLPDDIEY